MSSLRVIGWPAVIGWSAFALFICAGLAACSFGAALAVRERLEASARDRCEDPYDPPGTIVSYEWHRWPPEYQCTVHKRGHKPRRRG